MRVYVCVCVSSSSLSSLTDSWDFPDTLSPFVPITHRSRQVFQTTSCVCTVLADRPTLARPCVGVYWRTSLMSTSLLLQQPIKDYHDWIYIYIYIYIYNLIKYHRNVLKEVISDDTGVITDFRFCNIHQVAVTARISGFHWLSLSLSLCPYHPSLPASPLNYIQCPHRCDVNKFFLVGQHWHVYLLGPIEERYLWVCPFFSTSVLHVLFVLFGCFFEMGGKRPYIYIYIYI